MALVSQVLIRLQICLALCTVASFAAQMTAQEHAAQMASFELVWSTVRDHHPDTSFNGLDWDAVHASFKPRMERAKSAAEGRDILREMLRKLGVSHYSIIASDRYTAGDEATVSAAPGSAGSASPAPSVEPDIPAVKLSAPAAVASTPASTQPQETTVRFANLPETRVQFESRALANGAGYIRFNEFLDPISLMPRIGAALTEFANAPGVILDLRGNAGGLGIMAMGIAGFFVAEKGHQLGEMKMRGTTMKFTVFPRADVYSGRLAILVDGGSASTTEILAQGLQDLKRARIFGTRSAGATLTSDIIRLPDGDGFQYPNGSYVSTSGRVLEGNGVIPDVEVTAGGDAVIEAAASWIASR